MPTFTDLGVPAALVSSLTERGFTEPFPIQTATLPDTLAGKDVLGRGRTGSGKTLAFSLPVVARTADTRASSGAPRPMRPRALILAPTRELASQIHQTLDPLAQAAGLTTTVIFGGVAQNRQVKALKSGIDILVACPGRLEDLIGQGFCHLDEVRITVLDEADHMADLGFLPAVRRLLDRTPAGGQRLLFSATLDNGVDTLVKRYLDHPTTHSVDPAVAPVSTMTHHVLALPDLVAKRTVVRELASGTGRRILFTRTKHQAKKLAKQLTADGIPAVDLHGNLSQGARERNLAAFTTGDVRVLVATDIAARGIHVDDIELVVHVDPPAEHKAYLHRSGRTARAGSGGTVVTLQLPEQAGDVRDLTRKAKIRVTPQPAEPGSPAVTALVGEVADWVAPPAPVQPKAKRPQAKVAKARPQGAGGQSASDASGGGHAGRSRRRRTGGRGQGAGTKPAQNAPARTGGGTRGAATGEGQRRTSEQPSRAGGQHPSGGGRNRRRRGGRSRAGAPTPR